jgi:hypothetical protein
MRQRPTSCTTERYLDLRRCGFYERHSSQYLSLSATPARALPYRAERHPGSRSLLHRDLKGDGVRRVTGRVGGGDGDCLCARWRTRRTGGAGRITTARGSLGSAAP